MPKQGPRQVTRRDARSWRQSRDEWTGLREEILEEPDPPGYRQFGHLVSGGKASSAIVRRLRSLHQPSLRQRPTLRPSQLVKVFFDVPQARAHGPSRSGTGPKKSSRKALQKIEEVKKQRRRSEAEAWNNRLPPAVDGSPHLRYHSTVRPLVGSRRATLSLPVGP